jgi:hypothetical protein
MKKIIIYKIKDADEKKDRTQHYTLKGLRNYVLTELWDYWEGIGGDDANDYSKQEIEESDEYLFAYLESWDYSVRRILISDEKNMYF